MTVNQADINEALSLLDMFSKKESIKILQDMLQDLIDKPERLSIRDGKPDFGITEQRFDQIRKLGVKSKEFAACGAMIGLVVKYATLHNIEEAREFVKSAHDAISQQISK